MTRKMIPFAAGWLFGLFAAFELCVNGPLGFEGFVVLAAAALAMCAMSVFFGKSRFLRAALFFCAFSAACAYSAIYTSLRLLPLERLDGGTASIFGRVESVSDTDRAAVVVDGYINGVRGKALVYAPGFGGKAGDGAEFEAVISKLEDSPFFKARSIYLPDGVSVTASAVSYTVESGAQSLSDRIRSYSERVSLSIKTEVGGEAGELLSAMVTGDREAFSDRLYLNLNRAGIRHIAAVSGIHISIAALSVTLLLKKLRAPKIICAAAGEVCAVMYIIFSGSRTSAVRAGIMISVAILASVFRRRPDALNTICLCAFAMTVSNPYSAADSSLLLSLAGVFGAAVAGPSLIKEFGIKSKLARAFCVSVCSTAATAPFIMLYFDELSIVSPLVNLAAVPLCSAALLLGMLYAALGCTFPIAAWAAGALCRAVVIISEFVSGLRFAYIPLGFKAAGIAAGLSVTAVAAFRLLGGSVRKTSFLGAFCSTLIIAVYAAESFMTSGNLYISALSRQNYHAAVLRKGAECIIIDFEGRMSDGVERVIEREGLSEIRAVLLPNGAAAAYSSYSELSSTPDAIYLPAEEYVYDPKIKTGEISQNAEIAAFGANISVSGEVLSVELDGKSVTFSFLDGLTVINSGGEPRTYKGDVLVDEKISEAENGG